MRMRKAPGILLLGVIGVTLSFAQQKPNIKFGKLTPADFSISSPLVDSNTNAVVLSDIGSTEFEGNNKGWFTMVFKRHRRIKIINTKGFDAATVSITLYASGTDAEKLSDLRAVTHNLENGTLVTTKLENKDVFEERPQKRYVTKKFTFPALKPGSIVEYTYSINSDFLFNLQPWEFQGQYPVLHSEYEVSMPDFFNYVFLSQGYLLPERKSSERGTTYNIRKSSDFSASETYALTARVTDHKWTLQNVPPLKQEDFTSTIDNHIAKVEFQLAQYRFPNQPAEDVMGTWPKVSERLLKSEDFGLAYTRGNGWLSDDMKSILKGAVTDEDKVHRIYEYIRDNFTCSSLYGTRLSEPNSLKDVYRKKSGRVSDLNLLLIAMLRHESIAAEPVLVSLRERGLAHPVYPLLDRFNYLICEVALETGVVHLDASRPMLGYNRLPASCYNETAWVLSEVPFSIVLSPDSLKEIKRTSLILINSEKGGMDGTVTSILGDFGSYAMRTKMAKSKPEEYAKELTTQIGNEISVKNVGIDSLKKYDEPIGVTYDLHMKLNDEDIIYFNPLLNEAMKKNPFTSAERKYPVEMPYTFDETFVLDMEVPKGYKVDELPKSVRYKFNEDEGMFEYIFAKTAEKVQMRCRMAIFKANFAQDDYESLREFFSFAIKKQGEQIVFKKVRP
jgi:hypothetical protein